MLPGIFAGQKYLRGAEIGVARGWFSKAILTANPECELYCVDSWEPYDGYESRLGSDPKVFDKMYDQAKVALKKFPNVRLIRSRSMDAVKGFAPGSLDFVYIDANHQSPYVDEDIEEWAKRVRPGGIVSGHDFSLANVADAVIRYVDSHGISQWYVLDPPTLSWFFMV